MFHQPVSQYTQQISHDMAMIDYYAEGRKYMYLFLVCLWVSVCPHKNWKKNC